jgi:hypothetical protein
MFIEHLVYVRPLMLFFAKMFNLPGEQSMRVFSFSDADSTDPWSGPKCGLEFKKLATRWLPGGRSMGISQYRHVAIAFMRSHLQDAYHDHEEHDIFDLQANHTTRIANKVYAVADSSHPDIPSNIHMLFRRAST